jgi:hypothetical protein
MRKTYLYIFFCCKYKQLPLNVQGEIPISARESPKSLLDVEEIVTEGELEYAVLTFATDGEVALGDDVHADDKVEMVEVG